MAGALYSKLARALRQARDVPRALGSVRLGRSAWMDRRLRSLAFTQGLLPLATVWLSRSLVDAIVGRYTHVAIVAAILIAVVALAGEVCAASQAGSAPIRANWCRTI